MARASLLFARLDRWTGDRTDAVDRRRMGTQANYKNAKAMLARELGRIARRAVLVELPFPTTCFLGDGRIRLPKQKPNFPGVRVVFLSRIGWMCFASDRYSTWQANFYAIAKTLKGLGEMAGLGVVRQRQLYSPYVFAPPPADEPTRQPPSPQRSEDSDINDVYAASAYIGDHSAEDYAAIRQSSEVARRAYRAAAAKLHPDRNGGEHAPFVRLQRAWDFVRRLHAL